MRVSNLNKSKSYDIVIIGGGPAGMSAALWCSDLGLRSVLIEKSGDLGGQLSLIHNPIRNYLGCKAESGEGMREHFLRSLDSAKFDLLRGLNVIEADLHARHLQTGDGATFDCRAVMIATGVRRRKLGVDGEDEFYGKGLLASGAKEAENVKGKKVVVVGGGDAAIENALILSEHASSVTVVHRRNEFRARDEFLNRLPKRSNVAITTEHEVERFVGDESLRQVTVRDLRDGSTTSLECDFGLVRIGVQPNSELFGSQLRLDHEGYIEIDPLCRTSVENVFAVGDVANPGSLSLATAAGNAATAVSNFSKLK